MRTESWFAEGKFLLMQLCGLSLPFESTKNCLLSVSVTQWQQTLWLFSRCRSKISEKKDTKCHSFGSDKEMFVLYLSVSETFSS